VHWEAVATELACVASSHIALLETGSAAGPPVEPCELHDNVGGVPGTSVSVQLLVDATVPVPSSVTLDGRDSDPEDTMSLSDAG
jgi:hypothetical protein